MIFRDNPVLTRELLVTLRSPLRVHPPAPVRLRPGGPRLFLLAGRRGRRAPGRGGRGPPALRHLLPRPVLPGRADGADLRRRQHHRREGAEDLRAAPGQPAAARHDPGGQAPELAELPGDPDHLQPPADDPLLPAGRALALGDRAELPGADPGGRDLRAPEHRLLELLPSHQLGPGGQLPGHPPAGGRLRGADADRQRAGCATSSRSPCCRRGAWPPGPCWAS